MRSKFPIFWIVQFIFLSVLGSVGLFYPSAALQFMRGQQAPKEVERPAEALSEWVLGLEEVPVPNTMVREFFRNHEDVLHDQKKVWTPHDPSLSEFTQKASPTGWQPAEAINTAWEEFEEWILSCKPAPPPEDSRSIEAWLRKIDEIPAPSEGLRDTIAAQESKQRPGKELRLMILKADRSLTTSWQLASDHMRLTAPCVLAAALFTLFGLMTPSVRRPLARIFVLVCLFWTVAMLRSSLGPPQWNLTHGVLVGGVIFGFAMVLSAARAVRGMTMGWTLFLTIVAWWSAVVAASVLAKHETANAVAQGNVAIVTAIAAVMGIINAYYWLIGASEDPPQDDGGIAQRRPPQLWTVWLIQFVVLMANGFLALVFPGWIAEVLTHATFDYLTIDIVNDSIRMLGAWVIAMALFSYFALGVGRDWIWQGIGWIFCVVFLVLAISTIYNATSGEYSIWQYLYGFQGVVFIPFTVILLLRKDPWSTQNVERARRDDWSVTDLCVGALLCRSLLFGRRAFYQNGVGARGYLRVLPDESNSVPDNSFFVPGRQFPIQIRFANRNQEDDAGLDIRGCGMRLSSSRSSPLDLMFATGAFAPASTLLDFRRMLPRKSLKRAALKEKVVREGLAAGMRRAPACFTKLSYYHQLVLEWLTPDAEHYLVRLRLVPAPGDQSETGADRESLLGLPDDEDLRHLWLQKRRIFETRTRDYLRRNLRNQLARGARAFFQLEAQFRQPRPGDSLDWYDASLEWDARACPWHPLAEVVLEKPLSPEESEGLRIDPSNLPPSLNVPKPDNVIALRDPRTLAATRHRVASLLGRLRTWRRRPPDSLYSPDAPATKDHPAPSAS